MDNLEERLIEAIRFYWAAREAQAQKQASSGRADAGLRSAVTGGAHLDGITDLICEVIAETGFPSRCIFRKTAVELPGYFRPEKQWDLILVADNNLVAAIELKSQAGPSFGNNFNNRAEEAIGCAKDLWTAYREGRFPLDVKPWLGYFFLLEECPKSTSPVGNREPHFAVDKVFRGASYVDRYRILCERLMRERLYDATCFVTSTKDPIRPDIRQPSPGLSFASFASSLQERVRAFLGTHSSIVNPRLL